MSRASIALLLLAAFSAATGQLLLKIGARGRESWLEFLNPWIVCGLGCYALGTVIWIYALSFEKLTTVYAFTALTFVLVYLGGVFLIQEQISLPAIAGIVFILAGLYLIVGYNA